MSESDACQYGILTFKCHHCKIKGLIKTCPVFLCFSIFSVALFFLTVSSMISEIVVIVCVPLLSSSGLISLFRSGWGDCGLFLQMNSVSSVVHSRYIILTRSL